MAIYSIYDTSKKLSYQAPGDVYILDSAEDAGLNYPYSDRAGASITSLAFRLSGKIDTADQSYLDEWELGVGFFLTDTAYPLSDLRIISDAAEVLAMYEAFNADRIRWQVPIEF